MERLGLGGRRVLILHHDDLGLTHDILRVLVINDRAGLYD